MKRMQFIFLAFLTCNVLTCVKTKNIYKSTRYWWRLDYLWLKTY